MSILWYPLPIEQALSRRIRDAQEARKRQERQSPTATATPRTECVMLEWVEPVELLAKRVADAPRRLPYLRVGEPMRGAGRVH
jgi:hypothetical protein